MMYASILKQGEILAEMRHRSPNFIIRLSNEVGDSEERLNLLADFYHYFRDRLPRQDINLQFYLQICRSVRLISSTWQEHDDIVTDEIVVGEAVELIARAHPEKGDTPRVLADQLEERFGITAKGNRPFAGLAIQTNDLEELSERFHEAVRPLFVEFVSRLAAKTSGTPILSLKGKERLASSRFALIVNISAGCEEKKQPKEVDKMVKEIREVVARYGFNARIRPPYFVKRR